MQEGEEDLYPGLGRPYLLEDFAVCPVGALQRRLPADLGVPVAVIADC
jgi:hypothetical protein